MANIERHSKPAAATVTELYNNPKDNTTISTISLCNTNASADTCNVWVVPDAETRWSEHLIVAGNSISWNNSKYITIWLTPKVWSLIYVESTNGYISFSLYGREWA